MAHPAPELGKPSGPNSGPERVAQGAALSALCRTWKRQAGGLLEAVLRPLTLTLGVCQRPRPPLWALPLTGRRQTQCALPGKA